MKKGRFNYWTKQYVRSNTQQDIVDFLTKNPGYYSENELNIRCFGYDRNNTKESNKKYADLLRRAWAKGLITRRLKAGTTNRYEWFLPEPVTNSDSGEKNFPQLLENRNNGMTFTSQSFKTDTHMKITKSPSALLMHTLQVELAKTADKVINLDVLIHADINLNNGEVFAEIGDSYLTVNGKYTEADTTKYENFLEVLQGRGIREIYKEACDKAETFMKSHLICSATDGYAKIVFA